MGPRTPRRRCPPGKGRPCQGLACRLQDGQDPRLLGEIRTFQEVVAGSGGLHQSLRSQKRAEQKVGYVPRPIGEEHMHGLGVTAPGRRLGRRHLRDARNVGELLLHPGDDGVEHGPRLLACSAIVPAHRHRGQHHDQYGRACGTCSPPVAAPSARTLRLCPPRSVASSCRASLPRGISTSRVECATSASGRCARARHGADRPRCSSSATPPGPTTRRS